MANFTGAAPSFLDAKYIEKFLQETFDEPDLEVPDITVEPGSSFGDNYTCQIFRVTAYIANSSSLGENMKIIAKYQPPTLLSQDLGKTLNMFQNECNFFTMLQPKFQEVMLQISGARDYSPKCYKVEPENGVILMEDLKVQDFLLQKRGKALEYDQAVLVMEALATFHGISMHVLQKNPELKGVFNKCLWGAEGGMIIPLVTNNAQRTVTAHAGVYDLPEKYVEKLHTLKDDILSGLSEIAQVRDDFLNVLNHGDAWMNNMLFHFSDDTVDDIKLLDYQVVHYQSVANDLQFFFFTSVSVDVIKTKLDDLLERYYLKLLEIAPDNPDITLERIKAEFTARYKYGYAMTFACRPFVLYEDAMDMELLFGGEALFDAPYLTEAFVSDLRELYPIFEEAGLV